MISIVFHCNLLMKKFGYCAIDIKIFNILCILLMYLMYTFAFLNVSMIYISNNESR